MQMIIIKFALVAIFTLSVLGKLTGKTKPTFVNAGHGLKVMYSIALAEVVFITGLFTQYELVATSGLLAIMGGAIYTLYRLKVRPMKYALLFITIILLISLLFLQLKN